MNSELNINNNEIIIVSSDYNKYLVNMLVNGAIDAFYFYGGKQKQIKIINVPGAFEIPSTVNQILKKYQPDAIITLGAIIRGGTPHFDYIANEVSKGVSNLTIKYDVPIIFGVLTTNTFEQAIERASTKAGNKGWEFMESAIKTISTYKKIKSLK